MMSCDEKIKELEKEMDEYKHIIEIYEKILRLNEKELQNAYEIIDMYNNILEFSRKERMETDNIIKAKENIEELGRQELIKALRRIEDLEKDNKKLHKEVEKIKGDRL